MDSRSKILSAIKQNHFGSVGLPDLNDINSKIDNAIEHFKITLTNIGGAAIEVNSYEEVSAFIHKNFTARRIVSPIVELNFPFLSVDAPHELENIHLAILNGKFGVAENGAVWITNELMGDRALPFIAENLALVIRANNILPTLHDAYSKIESMQYEMGTFIAGPSKTADIEQSLVLGAHGAKSLTVFIMK